MHRSRLGQSLAGLLLQVLPYGAVCRWLLVRRGYKIDEKLFYYEGLAKRLRRCIKFALPYCLVMRFRKPCPNMGSVDLHDAFLYGDEYDAHSSYAAEYAQVWECLRLELVRGGGCILFDASILAQGLGNGSRSGIFTVTVELLRRFVRRKVCLALYNSAVAGTDADVLAFLKSDVELSGLHLLTPEEIRCDIGNTTLGLHYSACFSPAFEIPDWIRRARVPCFTIIYDAVPMLFPDLYQLKGASWTERVALSMTKDDHGFAISRCSKKDFLKYAPRLRPGNVSIIPLAASERFYVCKSQDEMALVRKKYGIPPNRPYFLTLSSIEPRKNLPFAIRAFAEFARSNADVLFVLAGKSDDAYAKVMERELQSSGIPPDRVVLTGYVDDHDLSALYTGAMAFVFLSVYEGFGLPPLEAMQCGTPVICSDNSSIPEVVGDAAIKVPCDALSSVVVAMHRMATDSSLRDKLRTRGLVQARKFSWDKAADIILGKMERVR